ncbi:MAG: amidoligase family protein [Myxococcales bacterium]|nr:amidoligase family protein [Myxococcales bacterium]
MGFEIELLAPPGSSRAALAAALAERLGGRVRRSFHEESEPSRVEGTPIFRNLTLGFDVLVGEGRPRVRCLDDLTLRADLDPQAAPRPGWYRIVSDDGRLLRLVEAHCDAEADLDAVLEPLARLFGTEPEASPARMIRVRDRLGNPVAIAAPLPGERERPCELVTAPLTVDRRATLAVLVDTARDLGFTIPREAALHIHFDGAPLCDARVLRRLVEVFGRYALELRARVGTNPACQRLGAWPDALYAAVRAPDFADLTWPEVQERLKPLGLSKYCDFNLRNLIHDHPDKHTFEVRILPVALSTARILEHAALFEGLLRWVIDTATDDEAPQEALGAVLERIARSTA